MFFQPRRPGEYQQPCLESFHQIEAQGSAPMHDALCSRKTVALKWASNTSTLAVTQQRCFGRG